MSVETAIGADRNGELEAAAAAYERALAADQPSLELLLNLAILYWQATDAGLASAKRLSVDFMATAGRRVPELLAEAERRFPVSAEPRFWKRYIDWADLGEPFDPEECRDLIRQDPASHTPAMYLFMSTQGGEAEAEALELLRKSEEERTTRARYVASVIRGVLKRGRRH